MIFIWTEYRKIWTRNSSEFGHFSRREDGYGIALFYYNLRLFRRVSPSCVNRRMEKELRSPFSASRQWTP